MEREREREKKREKRERVIDSKRQTESRQKKACNYFRTVLLMIKCFSGQYGRLEQIRLDYFRDIVR